MSTRLKNWEYWPLIGKIVLGLVIWIGASFVWHEITGGQSYFQYSDRYTD